MLSVIVVTWNAKRYVKLCLESIERQRRDMDLEVIVVDNASSDGTPELVQRAFPSVKLVRNDRNTGFANANNQGLRLCKGQYLCLVNSDVIVPDGCMQQLLGLLARNARVGMAGPCMLGPDGASRRSSMRFPTVWNSLCSALGLNLLFRRSLILGGVEAEPFEHPPGTEAEVDVLNGWFWMVRREAIKDVGLLDERFFMYAEDLDWCRRFHTRGWKIVLFTGAKAIHYGGGSSNFAPTRFYVEMRRANMQYVHKYCGAIARVGFAVVGWVHETLRVLAYSLLYLLWPAVRPEAAFKVKRSIACLMWMFKLRRDLLAER